jgi:signal transduction histidine kinase
MPACPRRKLTVTESGASHARIGPDTSGVWTADATEGVFVEGLRAFHGRADQLFVYLLLCDWLLAVGLSWGSPHLPGVIVAGLLNVPAAALVGRAPGWWGTRHAVAVTQMLWSGLLIQVTGGRAETHFHLYGSLAFLAFYRDWRVIATAASVIVADQSVRTAFWPSSVYGTGAAAPWHLLAEHMVWLAYEVAILIVGCLRSRADLRGIAEREAVLARSNEDIEREVEARTAELQARTAELAAANASLQVEMKARLQVETDLRQAHKLESVGRLASGVAHEINTPVQFVSDSVHFLRDATADLMGVIAALQQVQRSVVDGQPSRDAADRAARAADDADLEYLVENVPKAIDRSLDGLGRVATIVRSMKEFAHPDAVEMTAVDLNRAIESTLTIARTEYKYVAEVETDFGDLPPVPCHVGDINQAVLNIVVNAAHAIADVVGASGGRGRIAIRTRHEGETVLVAITDTGGGIPEEIRDRIFDPFFTTKEVGRGTGQGLAIARSVVVDKHQGELSIETAMGRGTTFFLRLPLHGTCAPAEVLAVAGAAPPVAA